MCFEAVYAPVVDFTNNLLTTFVCLFDSWKGQHEDVKAAYVNEDIDRDVFVSRPYKLPFDARRGTVCRLQSVVWATPSPIMMVYKIDKLPCSRNEFLAASFGYHRIHLKD